MNNSKWRSFFYNLEEAQQPKFDPSLSLISENIFNSLDLTHLSESELFLLMEGRKENIIKKYENILGDKALDALINFDEQYKYKHLGWMAKALAKRISNSSDNAPEEAAIATVISAISDFIKHKALMKKKDLNLYADIDDLLNAIEEDVIKRRIRKAREERDKGRYVSDQLFNSGQASVIYEDDRYFVIRPYTQESSCYFGSKTKWCISQEGNSYFSQYTEGEGKIFYFIKDDTKKNENFNYKGALEISEQDGEIYYNTLWDRFDNPIEIGSHDIEHLRDVLELDFEMPAHNAKEMVADISDHIFDNPPESPMADLERRINNNEWDGGFVVFNAYLETDGGAMLSISADINFEMPIENQRTIELLNAGEFDIPAAEEAILEALVDDDELMGRIAEDAYISYSKDLLRNEYTDDNIEVDIVQTRDQEKQEWGGWVLHIHFHNVRDEDAMHYSGSNISSAEEFLSEMQEEWGDGASHNLQEVFAEHIYRFIPQIAKEGAEKFRNLKANFQSGRYDLNDNIFYTIDDDEDENSDLNLTADFYFDIEPEMINWLFDGKEMTNTSGNKVMVTQLTTSEASRVLKLMFRSGGGGKGFLERGIYNVYQNAIQFAQRQLKLDFGPDFSFEDNLEMPEVPSMINVTTLIRTPKRLDTIVPYSAQINISYAIYIPFHKSEAELSALMNFFLYLSKHYDEISSYLYKYIESHSAPMNGGMYADNPRPNKILRENLYLDILDSNMFLNSINDQLRKQKRTKR